MEKIYDYPRIRTAGVIYDSGKFLLVEEHIKSKNNGLYWCLPGGGVEFGEKLEDSLKREIKEETGLEVDVNKLILFNENIEPRIHTVTAVYLVKPRSKEIGKEEAANNLEWFTKEKALRLSISDLFRRILTEGLYKE
jgi:ADP-ribose pyrophosphatase YjhB (NUDIX family)